MFFKLKKNGKIKGRAVDGGNKQGDLISKEEASSPTVATKVEIISCVIDAQ